MKLKYYLRGLGIGIAITALIMGISLGGKESLSDAEIKEKALQLGMVEESKVLFENSKQSTVSANDKKDKKDKIVSENKTVSAANTSVSKNHTEPESESNLPDEKKESDKTVIRIASGQSSYSVCEELKKLGLIEDVKAFDIFLCSKGYDRRLVVGEHVIPAGASLDEIGIALTK